MNARTRDLLTGLTAIIGLTGLAIMLMLFGTLANFAEPTYDVRVIVPTAGGLRETSPVTVSGVKVGQIVRTKNLALPERGVELTLRVQKASRIPAVALPSIERSFVGEASLEFVIPPDASEAELSATLDPKGSVTRYERVRSLLGDLTGAVQDPLEQLSATARNIDRMALAYTEVGERLNDLLAPRSPSEVDAVDPATRKAPNIATVVARLDAALANTNAWIGEESGLKARTVELMERAQASLREMEGVIASWKKAGESVETAASRIGSEVSKTGESLRQEVATIREDTGETLGTLRGTLTRIDSASGELATLLSSVNAGEGTAGQLVKNPDLYNSLRSASAQLERTLVEVQLLVEKLKAEGIKVGV